MRFIGFIILSLLSVQSHFCSSHMNRRYGTRSYTQISVIDPDKVRGATFPDWNPPLRRARDFSAGAFYSWCFRHTLRSIHKSSWLRPTRFRAVRARRVAVWGGKRDGRLSQMPKTDLTTRSARRRDRDYARRLVHTCPRARLFGGINADNDRRNSRRRTHALTR